MNKNLNSPILKEDGVPAQCTNLQNIMDSLSFFPPRMKYMITIFLLMLLQYGHSQRTVVDTA